MRLLTTFSFLFTCFTAIGQSLSSKKALTFYPRTYINSEYRYTDSTGIAVIIQNSLRKGGQYIDPAGKKFFSSIFWYRVINEAATPLELTVQFPTDSFTISYLPDSYLKVFLPTDTMTLAKESLYAYGATGLKSLLDSGLTEPTKLQRTINPKDGCVFYISVLDHQTSLDLRGELVLKEQGLFYKIDDIEIPCGKLSFKK